MILDALDANGLEGSEANVEGDVGGFGATLADTVEDLWSEVQAGCRSCD